MLVLLSLIGSTCIRYPIQTGMSILLTFQHQFPYLGHPSFSRYKDCPWVSNDPIVTLKLYVCRQYKFELSEQKLEDLSLTGYIQWLKQDSCSFVYLGVSSFFLKSHTWAPLGLWGPWRKEWHATEKEREMRQRSGQRWEVADPYLRSLSSNVPSRFQTVGTLLAFTIRLNLAGGM